MERNFSQAGEIFMRKVNGAVKKFSYNMKQFLIILATTGNFTQLLAAGLNWHGLVEMLLLSLMLFALPLIKAIEKLMQKNNHSGGLYLWLKSVLGKNIALCLSLIFWINIIIALICCLVNVGRLVTDLFGFSGIKYNSGLAILIFGIISLLRGFNLKVSRRLIIFSLLGGFFIPLAILAFGGILSLVHKLDTFNFYNGLLATRSPNYLIQIPIFYFGLEIVSYYYKSLLLKTRRMRCFFILAFIFTISCFILASLFLHSSVLNLHFSMLQLINDPALMLLAGLYYALQQMKLALLYIPLLIFIVISISITIMTIISGAAVGIQIAINDVNPYHFLVSNNRFGAPYWALFGEMMIASSTLAIIVSLFDYERIIYNMFNVASNGLMVYYIGIFYSTLYQEYLLNKRITLLMSYIACAILFCVILMLFTLYPSVYNSPYYIKTILITSITSTVLLPLSLAKLIKNFK